MEAMPNYGHKSIFLINSWLSCHTRFQCLDALFIILKSKSGWYLLAVTFYETWQTKTHIRNHFALPPWLLSEATEMISQILKYVSLLNNVEM